MDLIAHILYVEGNDEVLSN